MYFFFLLNVEMCKSLGSKQKFVVFLSKFIKQYLNFFYQFTPCKPITSLRCKGLLVAKDNEKILKGKQKPDSKQKIRNKPLLD